MLKWVIYINDQDPDRIPFIVPIDPSSKQPRQPTAEEAERAIRILNEDGENLVRLVCQNPLCKDKGGWIERGLKDAMKNVYHCHSCGKAMVR